MQLTYPSTPFTTIMIPENVLFDARNADWIENAAKNGIYFICSPSKTAVATINELLSNEVAAIAIRNNPEGGGAKIYNQPRKKFYSCMAQRAF